MKPTIQPFVAQRGKKKLIQLPTTLILLVVMTMSLACSVSVYAENAPASPTNPNEVYPSDSSLGDGIIGVALHLSAHRVGDPAKLYIRAIHPEGPAAKMGLAHGDEILAVDAIDLTGKTYEQIVRMIRGNIGEKVTLQVNGAKGKREVTILRVSEEKLVGQRKT